MLLLNIGAKDPRDQLKIEWQRSQVLLSKSVLVVAKPRDFFWVFVPLIYMAHKKLCNKTRCPVGSRVRPGFDSNTEALEAAHSNALMAGLQFRNVVFNLLG